MGILRVFFALSVLLGHIQLNYLVSPIYAVQGFYIISGFYMSLILNEKYTSHKSNITFYKKRFMRILPTYWLVACIALLLAVIYYRNGDSNILLFDFHHFPTHISLSSLLFIIISNSIIWGQDLALFLGISPETGEMFFSTLSYAEEYPMPRYSLIPVAWSISSEFTFYLIAPYILRNKKYTVHILFLISLISNIYVNHLGLNNSNWRFRFFPSELIFFISGYYSYRIFTTIRKYKITTKFRFTWLISLLLSLTILLNIDLPYAIKCCILLVLNTISIPYLFYSYSNSKPDRNIGELSYPLYLIHPIVIVINELFGLNVNSLIIGESFLLSFLCYKYYINKIEFYRNKL